MWKKKHNEEHMLLGANDVTFHNHIDEAKCITWTRCWNGLELVSKDKYFRKYVEM